MKDNFSAESDNYAKNRPSYPGEFFQYLNTLINGTENAWDCATGNGQVAVKISTLFKNVYATDISEQQVGNAVQLSNIHYSVQPAEATDFRDNFFDLIIVAQAVHWFDFEKFYAEVKRTAKTNSLLSIIGYGRLKTDPRIESVIEKLYTEIVVIYWDKERRYIEEDYRTIPFPFEEISVPDFESRYNWTLEHLIGYLGTWSAVKHYIKQNGNDPVALIRHDLADAWQQADTRTITFPLLTRIGKVNVM